MYNNYYFIVNPAAGDGKKLSVITEIQAFCQDNGLDFEVVITKQPKQAVDLAKKAAEKFEVVVAVGGDGTINEVASGLVDTDAALGIIPTGSGNDFAAMLGLSKNPKKALKTLLGNQTRVVDIGLVNSQRYFINGLGVGFDGEVASRVRGFSKFSRGFVAYLLTVLRTLATYKFKRVKISIDGNSFTKKILLVATCNGTTYGGGFKVAPSAKIDDGLFTVCVIDKCGRFYALRNIPKIMRGAHLSLPIVHTYTGKNVIIESEDNLMAQVDGEILEQGNKFEVSILPEKIKIITP